MYLNAQARVGKNIQSQEGSQLLEDLAQPLEIRGLHMSFIENPEDGA